MLALQASELVAAGSVQNLANVTITLKDNPEAGTIEATFVELGATASIYPVAFPLGNVSAGTCTGCVAPAHASFQLPAGSITARLPMSHMHACPPCPAHRLPCRAWPTPSPSCNPGTSLNKWQRGPLPVPDAFLLTRAKGRGCPSIPQNSTEQQGDSCVAMYTAGCVAAEKQEERIRSVLDVRTKCTSMKGGQAAKAPTASGAYCSPC